MSLLVARHNLLSSLTAPTPAGLPAKTMRYDYFGMLHKLR